ncbi:MAG: VTT domain-containing protein [Patescibacteria group bacterium]|nr:VTT domain-containing protein [Patescibacteria group bacterium]MDE1945985.1 VTT domain-containing protein [Patescibacteria group bacterium]
MTAFVSTFLSFVLLYKYWAIALIVASSALILPLPTNIVIVAAGAFASQGYLNLTGVIADAIIANIATDCIVFYFCRHYAERIFDRWIKKWDGKFMAIERRLRTYAFGTVFLTRIAGPFAPYVNFVAGIIGVRAAVFIVADILGNALAFLFFASAGYFLGNYWQDFTNDIWIITAAVVVAFIAYLAWKIVRKRKD